jgi:molybdopterin-guanine dinucleotide biosynthesis protein A
VDRGQTLCILGRGGVGKSVVLSMLMGFLTSGTGSIGVNDPDCDSPVRASESDAVGFVLAGGESSRMGRDKAQLTFRGRPLIEHALAILAQAGLPARIAGAPPPARVSLEAFAPIIEDASPGLGPLSGICAALAATSARYAVFLPIDLPLLPPSLLVFLLRYARITGAAVTIPSVSGYPQTFPAVINRTALPTLENELNSGLSGCFSAFQAASRWMGQDLRSFAVELLAQCGQVWDPQGRPPVHWFFNLNTPDDLARAEALQRRHY